MLISLGLLAAILYVFSAGRLWRGRSVSAVVPVALVLQAAALGLQLFHGPVLRLGMAEAVSLFAWQSALTLWLFSFRDRVEMLGVLLYPVVSLCALFGALASNAGAGSVPIDDWRIQIHIVISTLATGFLTLACIQALALAFVEELLRRRHVGAGHVASFSLRLPPLQTMERLLFQMVIAGFFLLSLTLLSGLLFVHNLMAQHLVQKTALSFLAWLMFGLLLWGRHRYGWRGRTAVRWVLFGYVLLVGAYFGSKWLVEGVMGTHWS
ncbi:MAG TPA: cytochrome c biogenesis protein CcsA [Nevskiaceae bacterium]|nr:cytochrome c biogenesis protein CcsA [Nevskiaceae bacterium]